MMAPGTSFLTWASFRLAQAFGWTPQQVQALTMGQVALYLGCLNQEADGHGA